MSQGTVKNDGATIEADRQASPGIFSFSFDDPCPACGSASWQRGPRIPRWPTLVDSRAPRLIECGDCGTAHLPDVHLEDYVTNAPVTVESVASHRLKARKNMQLVYPLLARHLGTSQPHALIVGCSTGFEVEALLQGDFEFSQITGLEPNRGAARIAQERLAGEDKVDIVNGYLEDSEGPYEFVNATMVLEHVVDPLALVEGMAQRQSEGGIVSIQVFERDLEDISKRHIRRIRVG